MLWRARTIGIVLLSLVCAACDAEVRSHRTSQGGGTSVSSTGIGGAAVTPVCVEYGDTMVVQGCSSEPSWRTQRCQVFLGDQGICWLEAVALYQCYIGQALEDPPCGDEFNCPVERGALDACVYGSSKVEDEGCSNTDSEPPNFYCSHSLGPTQWAASCIEPDQSTDVWTCSCLAGDNLLGSCSDEYSHFGQCCDGLFASAIVSP